jgi:pyruvate/2-oxoglutarate dehydrogenase complex dihydrolipoamide dehydrogenase (E3) component
MAAPQKDETASTDKDIKHTTSKVMETDSDVKHYDTVVLGGGKGGKSLALALAAKGISVALIEEKMIGGSCINVACIPTKTLVASSKLVNAARLAAEEGFSFSGQASGEVKNADKASDASTAQGLTGVKDTNLKAALARKRAVVEGMVNAHWKLFDYTDNLDFFYGKGKFISAKSIEIELNSGARQVVTGDKIYINTGSRPLIPSYEGLEECGYLTSTSIMELEKLPEHLGIVGGGYIALEFAQIFRRLGSRVTIIERGNHFLPREDAEIGNCVKQIMLDEGIEILFDSPIKSLKKNGENTDIDLGEEGILSVSHLLVATGRLPNTENLGLETAGVALDSRNFVKVDSRLETNVPGIFAIGDCKGGPFFTHLSWDDYRILRDNALSKAGRTTDGRIVPYTLFTDPELGRVGMTEAEAKQAGHKILVAKIEAKTIPRAQTERETKGLLKAVIDAETKQILGASILSAAGGEIVSVIQVAMLAKMPYTDLANVMFSHPTMAESLNLLFAKVSAPI